MLETYFPVFSQQLAFIQHLLEIIRAASIPFLRNVIAQPTLLAHPTQLRERFFMCIWQYMADGVDEAGAESKQDLIFSRASGVVLDLGAGYGHSAKYLDKSRVSMYVALEPNPFFHEKIRVNATLAGFSPSQVRIISHRGEETKAIVSSLGAQQVDTVLSILTLCGIPDAEQALTGIVADCLKPGGTLLFYEHVRCDISSNVAWWQCFWTHLWEPIIGCRLDKPSHHIVDNIPIEWKERQVWGKNGEEANLFWHQTGCYIKA